MSAAQLLQEIDKAALFCPPASRPARAIHARRAARFLRGHSLSGAQSAPRSPSLCLAALQSMRTSLGRQQGDIVRYSCIMRRLAFLVVIVAGLAGTAPVCALSPELPSLRRSDGVELKVSLENTLPELILILPGYATGEKAARILFPEHVTAK